MNKRGLNEVIIVGLVILLSIAAVTILWSFVRPALTDVGEGVNTNVFSASFSIPSEKVKLDPGLKYVSFAVTRNSGKADLSGLKVILEDSAGNSILFDEPVLAELESRVINLSYAGTSLSDLEKISVAPVIQSGSKTIQGQVADTFDISPNKKYDLPPSSQTGLVGYWSLNDDLSDLTTTDSSESGNDGTCIAGACPVEITGKINGAYEFDGVDDEINLGDIHNFDENNEFTLAAWFICHDCTGGSNYNSFIDTLGSAGGYRLLVLNNILRFTVRSSTSALNSVVTPGGTIQNNILYHGAGVFDGTELRLYLNGTLIATTPFTIGDIGVITTPLFIGRTPNNAQWFDGMIDEARVYNRALSDEEIQALFEQTS